MVHSECLAHEADRAFIQRIVEPEHPLLRPIGSGPGPNPPPLQLELEPEEPRHPVPEVEERQRGQDPEARRDATRPAYPREETRPEPRVAEHREHRDEALDVEHGFLSGDFIGNRLLDDPQSIPEVAGEVEVGPHWRDPTKRPRSVVSA